MYEFHGWFALHCSPDEDDQEDLNHRVKDLADFISRLSWPSGSAEVHANNGNFVLVLDGLANRRRSEAAEIDEILGKVGTLLEGSYGLLYERAEDLPEPPGPGAFRVRVMARGRVRVESDPFLSPAFPVIED